MRLPDLLAVDDDPSALDDVERQLVQRYAHDYRIESLSDPDNALQMLQELANGGEDVALVLAASTLPSTSGRHLLEHVRQLHPHAGRALLVSPNV
jgi:thioredoxin reductase (NADPH)